MNREPDRYRYWAFISYSHADEAWAKWLHRALETYRVPHRLVGGPTRFGPRPRRLFPVFRDRDELSSAAELGSVIEAALRESRYLIVVCSPAAAKSAWVDAEIRRYKSRGRQDRVLALIVDGQPNAEDPAQECFPLALRRQVDAHGELTDAPAEPIAADARPFADHKHGARLKLLAGLLEVGYDELRQRERRRRLWARVQAGAAALAGVALLAAVWAGFERREIQRTEQARLDRLEQLGRQELRDHRHARAAVYLTEVLRGGRDIPALRYSLARAMRPVDAVLPRVHALDEVVLRSALAGDGRHLLTVNAGSASWWDLQTGQRLGHFEIPQDAFLGAPRLAADAGHAVISGAGSTQAHPSEAITTVLDLRRGQVVGSLPGTIWNGAGNALRPDGRHALVTRVPAADDEGAKAWTAVVRLTDAAVVARLETADGNTSASFSPDGRHIVTGGEGAGEIVLWDAGTFRQTRRIAPRQHIAHSAYWSGRGMELLSVNEAGAVKLWDGASGQLLDALGSHSLFALAVDQAAQRYWLTTSVDGARVWDLERGQPVFHSEAFGGFNDDADLDATGRRILAQHREGGPGLWSVPEQGLEYRLDVAAEAVAEVRFVPGDQRILIVTRNGRLRWLDAEHLRRPLARLQHGRYRHPAESPGVGAVAATSDGRHWISGGADGALRRWTQERGRPVAAIEAHQSTVISLVTVADTEASVSLDSSGRIIGWDGRSDTPAWAFEADPEHPAARLTTHRHTTRVVVHRPGAAALVLDGLTGEHLQQVNLEPLEGNLRLLPPGHRLLSIDARGQVRIRDLDAPGKAIGIGGEASGPGAFAISADRHRLLRSIDGGALTLYDLRSGQELNQLDVQAPGLQLGLISELALSDDGAWVAAATVDGAILTWHPGSGRTRVTREHLRPVTALQFDAASRLLASGDDDGMVVLREVDSGRVLDHIDLQRDKILEVAFGAEDTRVLVRHRLDDALRLWDISLETRSLAQIERRLACAVPWQTQGLVLVARNPDAADCAGLTSSP